jgi:hypothetical protein
MNYKFNPNNGEIAIAYVNFQNGKQGDIIYLDKEKGFPDIDLSRKPDLRRTILPCVPGEEGQVIRFFISGVAGVGKSTFANEIIKDRLDYFPTKKVWLFSPFEDDESIDRDLEDKIQRVEPSDYDVEEFENSIVIFDDIDSYNKESDVATAYKTLNALEQAGRKQGTDCIYINHTLKNGPRTKYVIGESNYVVVFPNAGNNPQIASFLKDYCGLSKFAIREILEVKNSRWVIIHKAFPVYVMTQQAIYFPK